MTRCRSVHVAQNGSAFVAEWTLCAAAGVSTYLHSYHQHRPDIHPFGETLSCRMLVPQPWNERWLRCLVQDSSQLPYDFDMGSVLRYLHLSVQRSVVTGGHTNLPQQ